MYNIFFRKMYNISNIFSVIAQKISHYTIQALVYQ